MKMKNLIIVLIAVFCAGLIPNASALAADGGTKLATMDLKKVLELSNVGKLAQANVKKKYEEYQAKFSKRQAELVALKDEIEKKRSVWSDDVLNKKEHELKKGMQDLQDDTKYADSDMQDYQKKQIGPILKELEGVIDDYGKSHHLSLILDTTRGVLYQDASLDVSADIAAALDKKQASEAASPTPKPKAAK